MNVLDRHHSVVVDLVVAEARNVWSGATEAGQGQRLRRVGEEELHCEKVALTHSPVEVRIELVVLEDRRRGTGIKRPPSTAPSSTVPTSTRKLTPLQDKVKGFTYAELLRVYNAG